LKLPLAVFYGNIVFRLREAIRNVRRLLDEPIRLMRRKKGRFLCCNRRQDRVINIFRNKVAVSLGKELILVTKRERKILSGSLSWRARVVYSYFDKNIVTFIPVNAEIDQRFKIYETYWAESIVEMLVVKY
jgi:hypothetical protein